ncbi:lipoate--protein ligase family protein [Microbacterium enclense]|uniref:lipoyl protein ligase domain-containing protein n=1 Tax=Microbacterium enclense TaxID=993073 RepID=UPI0021A77936|nr:lipoate--protein ligase family protein [Microbacterium enclense]MCT2085283.1 lipoate--protein ligase family protein [Microbacterium enclense]
MRLLVADETDGVSGRDPAREVLTSLLLLHRVAADAGPAVVRVFSPEPTVAFSRRESLHPRFAEAAAAARAAGHLPIVRPAGGRAVVLDADWLVIDIVQPEEERGADAEIFRARGEHFVGLARRWGVDARLGPVPGEYCPGDWSVNARGRVKLVGTAQRVVRGARLFTASLPLRVTADARRLLDRVNGILDLPWDPTTAGSLTDETSVTEAVVRADVTAFFAGAGARHVRLDDLIPDAAGALAALRGDRIVTSS